MAYKIKFYCRSFDLRLYEKSKLFYESLGYPCVRLTDQTADGYFYTMLRDTDCDIAINVDEDCFLADPKAVLELVDYVIANGYANAACPDGGVDIPRLGNPIITNPFFNIFNLQLIRQQTGTSEQIRQAVKSFDYKAHLQEMIDKYPKEMLTREPLFDRYGKEPYYPFFFWLAYNFKTLYLPCKMHQDKCSTMLYDLQGHLLCQHSWLARFYSTPTFISRHWLKTAGEQKTRINALIAETATFRTVLTPEAPLIVPTERFSDTLRYAGNKVIRWSIKVPQRVANWPNKLKKKLNHEN